MLNKLTDLNREFVKSGKITNQAMPLLKAQMLEAASLDAKLQRELDEANRRRMVAKQDRKLQHSNNFGIDYEKYRRYRTSVDQRTREKIEKAAILDLLDDRDLGAMDAKLRALGY